MADEIKELKKPKEVKELKPSSPSDKDSTNLLKEGWHFIFDVIKIVVISLLIIIPIRVFIMQPFYVKGASMEPNLYDHEYLIIDELSYRFREPARGEIIVFRYPRDPSQFYIKRIIALPEEKIEILNGKITIYNPEYPAGIMLLENYLSSEYQIPANFHYTKILGEDEYFVMGDNRPSSLDSRIIGPIKKKMFVGRSWLRAWPFSRFTFFELPEYNLIE